MKRNKVIKNVIRTVEQKRQNVLDYLNENDNISYKFVDLKLSHYFYNIRKSVKIKNSVFCSDSEKFIDDLYKSNNNFIDLNIEELNKIIPIDWKKYYRFLIEDYDDIIAELKGELIVIKNNWTPVETITLITAIFNGVCAIINAAIPLFKYLTS